jgi:predicted phage terminase large subunit-like protein
LVPSSAIHAERIRRAKASLSSFCRLQGHIPAAHHSLLIEKLEAVERGEIARLMIFMPPGSAKSTYASIDFPAWYIGRNPTKNVITGSYAQRLSRRFARKCRNVVRSQTYREVFGFGLAAGAKAAEEWEVEPGGEFTATSVDGAVTGRRGDVILVDDPVKGRKEADSPTIRETAWHWWVSDLRTRLKPFGALIVIMTRWHEDDIAGRILPLDYDGESGVFVGRDGEEWHVLSIRAEAEANDPLGRKPGEFLWPEWFAGGMLAREKIAQGPRNWSALYQQRPSPEEGDYFKSEWVRWYDKPPAKELLRIYGASDYAVTADGGDFTVHGIFGVDAADRIFVLDWWRQQAPSDVWIETLCDLVQKWKPVQWAEESGQIEKGVGPFLEKRMRERGAYVYREQFTSAADKPTRAQSIRGRMAMGMVYFPRTAPWVNTLVRQLLTFPTGTNDDDVDVMSLLGRMLDVLMTGDRPKPPPEDIKGIEDVTLERLWDDHEQNLGGERI